MKNEDKPKHLRRSRFTHPLRCSIGLRSNIQPPVGSIEIEEIRRLPAVRTKSYRGNL